MQRPRHAQPSRGNALRTCLRAGLVAVLATPSVLGVGALVSNLGHTPGPQVNARPAEALRAPAAVVAAGVRGAPSPLAATPPAAPRPADPRGATAAVARSGARLARAAGAVASRAGARLVTRVVGLGDSVPAGTNCDCTGYVDLLAQEIGQRQGTTVGTADLAVPGQTTAGLLGQLDAADVQQAVAGADVVVVTIGANDVEGAADPASCPGSGQSEQETALACYRDQLATLTANLDLIAGRLAAFPTGPGARVLVTGYWNVFTDGAVARARGSAYTEVADAATRIVNERIGAAATAHGATFVDLFTPFRGSDGSRDATPLLAADGDHPDAAGHQVIEQALASAL